MRRVHTPLRALLSSSHSFFCIFLVFSHFLAAATASISTPIGNPIPDRFCRGDCTALRGIAAAFGPLRLAFDTNTRGGPLLVEDFDSGTATLRGGLFDPLVPSRRADVSIRFVGRTSSPAGLRGAPVLDLSPRAYAAGRISVAHWYYYRAWSATLTGRGDLAGLSAVVTGRFAQLGFGANGRNGHFGMFAPFDFAVGTVGAGARVAAALVGKSATARLRGWLAVDLLGGRDECTGMVCNDGNECTDDVCDRGTCRSRPIACDDGDPCTDEMCVQGRGCVSQPAVCDDGNRCTADACIVEAGGCTHSVIDCNDFDECTIDSCDPAVGCVHTPRDCDDGNECTIDKCNATVGCVHIFTELGCDDNNSCTVDRCDPRRGCVHQPIVCVDADACTVDTCHPQTGCTHTPAVCDDGDPCTVNSCDTRRGCVFFPRAGCRAANGSLTSSAVPPPPLAFTYGRLVPALQPLEVPLPLVDALTRPDGVMADTNPSRADDAATREAGYTYFAQFVDHDLSEMQGVGAEFGVATVANVSQLVNFRTAWLDLDTVYGNVFGKHDPRFVRPDDSAKMLIGNQDPSDPNPIDLPRTDPSGRIPLVGDVRNDENIITSQIHGVFLEFHNRAVDALRQTVNGSQLNTRELFNRARQLVTWHYQWIILNEFLPKIISTPNLISETIQRGPRTYKCDNSTPPTIPVEFSLGVYRFGHSMVRPSYSFNSRFFADTFPKPAGQEAFGSTIRGGQNVIPLWDIAWNRFFPNATARNTRFLQFGRKIDTKITQGLMANVLKNGDSMAARNIKRGIALGLPSGESLARALFVKVLSRSEVGLIDSGIVANVTQTRQRADGTNETFTRLQGFSSVAGTPLWYYILREAEVQTAGERLGELGSRVLVETIVGVLKCDNNSILNEGARQAAQNAVWTPEIDSPLKRPDGASVKNIIDIIVFVGRTLD